ncbi:hypothetical protein WDZ17_11025 [Pseudokineococcus basanitobsidens]|uniref:UDP-N-acetylglucosamine:LPS N-acetylglucosamine transferase n=1 Tax=Pseudokineococcus basanitobsidens TaxID=1926649 RepID=A0ABU8RLB4_9ACTN
MSSNGSGMGHLTRLLALGRRASTGTEVSVVSMSSAVAQAVPAGMPYQYVPSADDMGVSARRWNVVLHRRLGAAIEQADPDVLVFDGTYPYRAVAEARRDHPRLRLVWSRRPMWKPGIGARQLALTRQFDLVLEPGELAAAYDAGLTVGRRDALPVRPVTLLDQDEVLPAVRARRELDLDPAVPTALVTLGAGSWQDVDSELGGIVRALRRRVPDVEVCLVRPSIARSTSTGHGVRSLSLSPLSRYLAAFDVVVTAAGYNTFHETVAFGGAGAFVGVQAQLDDQPRRARWARDHGVGLELDPRQPASREALGDLVADAGLRERLRTRSAEMWPGNGAAEAMAAVEAVARGGDAVEARRARDAVRAAAGQP